MRILIILLSFIPFLSKAQTEAKAEHSHLRVFTLPAKIQAGDLLDVGLDFTMEPGWHIYWRNPGDSGTPPRVEVTGGHLMEWRWPVPERLPLPPLTNYGYEARVVFPITVKPEPGARELQLDFEWLVCKVECVPAFASLKLLVPWAPERLQRPADAPDRVLWEEYVKRVPVSSADLQLQVEKITETELEFRLRGADIAKATEAMVYPNVSGVFRTDAPEMVVDGRDVRISLLFSPTRDQGIQETQVTTVLKGPLGQKAFESNLPLREPPPQVWRILVFALLGGLLLNLMPCVFPVLSLKIFSLLKESDFRAVRYSGWSYTFGVLVSFTALGLFLLLLRSGSALLGWEPENVGWGFQLQSPVFVFLSAFLFFVMGLNFIGAFDFGSGLMSRAGQWGRWKGLTGSFGTGVLAVFVASPCTAPFMGVALGATLFLPAFMSLLVFLTLGLGLALPVLILGYLPGIGKRLPKPGPWMESFKEFMAFPLFATVAWLLWVLGLQTQPQLFLQVLLFLVFTGFVVWLFAKLRRRHWRILFLMALLGLGVSVVQSLAQSQAKGGKVTAGDESEWRAFQAELVTEAKGTRPIFVDFTASWCITCQVNKIGVLRTDKVGELFRKHNVLLLVGDWTDRDPAITDALKSFGRNSVPLYVYYDREGRTKILPEILTVETIEQLWRTP